jgi:hypothetical protein
MHLDACLQVRLAQLWHSDKQLQHVVSLFMCV